MLGLTDLHVNGRAAGRWRAVTEQRPQAVERVIRERIEYVVVHARRVFVTLGTGEGYKSVSESEGCIHKLIGYSRKMLTYHGITA